LSKVTLKGYILVPDADLPAVRNELARHIAMTREEAGCLVFEVSQDEDNRNRFNVYEEFRDRSAFRFHQARVSGSEWGRITASVERHYRIEDGG
jgi:quinol monooxygenase YgiN